jgi:hypothetical protein
MIAFICFLIGLLFVMAAIQIYESLQVTNKVLHVILFVSFGITFYGSIVSGFYLLYS